MWGQSPHLKGGLAILGWFPHYCIDTGAEYKDFCSCFSDFWWEKNDSENLARITRF